MNNSLNIEKRTGPITFNKVPCILTIHYQISDRRFVTDNVVGANQSEDGPPTAGYSKMVPRCHVKHCKCHSYVSDFMIGSPLSRQTL